MNRRTFFILALSGPLLAIATTVIAWWASETHVRQNAWVHEAQEGVILIGGLSTALLLTAVLLTMARWRAEAGKLARAMTISLRESEERYRSVVGGVQEVIFQTDMAGRVEFLNPAWSRITGFEIESALGRGLREFILDEDREDDAEKLRPVLEGDVDSCRFETRVRTLRGAHRWMEIVARATRGPDGAVKGLSGLMRDVTEKRRADAFQSGQRRVLELLATGEALPEVLSALAGAVEEQSPDILCSILLVDRTGRKLVPGGVAGLPADYIASLGEVPIGPDIGSCGSAAWSRQRVIAHDIANDPRWAICRDLALAHGLRACWSEPILNRTGAVLGTLALYYRRPAHPGAEEIALIEGGAKLAAIAIERRREETALALARDQAIEAARLKSEFLANMSHELRTPMNGVIGMTELALESEPGEEATEYLIAVRSSARHLLAIIDDMLDFSRLEAGRLELDPVPFHVGELFDEALKPFALRARAKGVAFACEVAADVPPCLVGDARRIRQVMINLVGNALKFTERGAVTARAGLERLDGDEAIVWFSVADTGIGISADKHALIFDPFTQGDGSATRRHGGTGLGLAISRQLVDLMGGHLTVESAPGRGSTFRFTVRVAYESHDDCCGDAAVLAAAADEDWATTPRTGTEALRAANDGDRGHER